MWRFFDFINSNGTNPIEDWYQCLSDEVKETMDGLLKNCSKTENHLEWPSDPLSNRKGSANILELKFKAAGKQYRLFYIFQGQRRVVLLAGCFHKQKRYYPQDSINIAYKRAKEILNSRASTNEREIEKDI